VGQAKRDPPHPFLIGVGFRFRSTQPTFTNTPAPSVEAVYALVKLLNKVMVETGGGVVVTQQAAAH
jgi:hypothetical protein